MMDQPLGAEMKRAIVDWTSRLVGHARVDARIESLQSKIESLEATVASLAKQLGAGRGISSSASTGADLDAIRQLMIETSDRVMHDAHVSRDEVIHRVNDTNHNLYLHLREATRLRELYYRDMMVAIDRVAHVYPDAETVKFSAERSIAFDTDDHIKPWGSAHDNTRLPRFVRACEAQRPGRLTFLDLGCSGGGLVLDFLLRGHRAYGIEGSDFSKAAQRAEWRVLPHNLFTGDITRRFDVQNPETNSTVRCDIVSMWEVLEHIAESDLPGLFDNIKRHLKPGGLFVGSIALVPDDHGGASYHRTVQSRDWWVNRFRMLGLPMTEEHGFAFEDFCRGTGNGPMDDNFRQNPSVGTHFVARVPQG